MSMAFARHHDGRTTTYGRDASACVSPLGPLGRNLVQRVGAIKFHGRSIPQSAISNIAVEEQAPPLPMSGAECSSTIGSNEDVRPMTQFILSTE